MDLILLYTRAGDYIFVATWYPVVLRVTALAWWP